MHFEQTDIEKSKLHLQSLIENGVLILGIEQLDEFVSFLCDKINNESNVNYFLLPKDAITLKDNLFLTLQSLSFEKLQALKKSFIEDAEFDILLHKSFQLEKRRQLKKKLIQFDSEFAEVSTDETITKAFQIEKRKALKQKLEQLENESKRKETKVISFKSYLKAISIAASLILIFLLWQPQHVSDKRLFADYSSSLNNSSINDFTKPELIREQTGLRGGEEHFKNYSYNETHQLLEAISLIKQKDFETAKEVFHRLKVEKEKNPGLALYIGIAELNTGNLDAAIMNLEYLSQLSGFPYLDEAKFHLAFAYLKAGERGKAKVLLHDLVNSKSKFSNEAQQTLKKIRWF